MMDKLTKSDKNQQNSEKLQLTDRQLKVIPIIVANPTYTEGCKKAKLNRTTFYKWLKIPEFKAELDRQRDRSGLFYISWQVQQGFVKKSY